jgi:hypothetical protein
MFSMAAFILLGELEQSGSDAGKMTDGKVQASKIILGSWGR